MRTRLFGTSLVALLTVACASPLKEAAAPTQRRDSALPAAPAQPKEACSPGVTILGDPNGLFWDAPRERLLIADAASNTLLAWRPGEAVTTLAELPLDAGKPGLGQPVVDQNGSVLVPRFGYGSSGTILRVLPNGSVDAIGGLDVNRRRIGLALTRGRLFETYFVKDSAQPSGGVAEVNADGSEVTLAAFQKPIGVLAGEDALYVSDQAQDGIFRCAPRAPTECARFATLPAPDLLAFGPGGSLLTGGKSGELRLVDSSGSVRTLGAAKGEIRGVAWDGARRSFVARRTEPNGTIEVCSVSE